MMNAEGPARDFAIGRGAEAKTQRGCVEISGQSHIEKTRKTDAFLF